MGTSARNLLGKDVWEPETGELVFYAKNIHTGSKGNKIISIYSQVFRSNSLYAVRRVIKMYTPKPELVELKYLVN
jgi:hypothetical protein